MMISYYVLSCPVKIWPSWLSSAKSCPVLSSPHQLYSSIFSSFPLLLFTFLFYYNQFSLRILFHAILYHNFLFHRILFPLLSFPSYICSFLLSSTLLSSPLFYSILFYSILFYSILFYSILFYSIVSISSLFIIPSPLTLTHHLDVLQTSPSPSEYQQEHSHNHR